MARSRTANPNKLAKWLKCSDPVIRQAHESNTRYAMKLERICELLISVDLSHKIDPMCCVAQAVC
jgi:hypothetical protein